MVAADTKKVESFGLQDFINVISFRRKLLAPDTVKRFVDEAVKENLLVKKGERFAPNFSTSGIVVPLDFTVSEKDLFSASKDKPLIDRILDAATASGKLTKKEAIAEAHEFMENLKLITFQTALLAIMNEHGIDISDFLREIEERKLYA